MVSWLRLMRVMFRWQVLEVVPGVSVQGLGATAELEPDGLVETTKLTMPRGALLGALSVSATVTVQERGLLAGVEAGQSSVVEVVRRSEEHTSELQSRPHLVCRLLLEIEEIA